jgi:hypothetical protein
MRPQFLFRRSRPLLQGQARRPSFPVTRPDHILARAVLPTANPSHVPHRLLSSSTPGPDDATPSEVQLAEPDTTDIPFDEPDKPKRRNKILTTSIPKELDSLPVGLDILWTPDENPQDPDTSHSSALPPPEILEEALNNLHIILHPKTQHRAIYTSPAGPPTEPTFALYCPIEGGEYIIDATVRELARRTGSEVVVLDAVQLAAGEWGAFGKCESFGASDRNPIICIEHSREFTSSATEPSPFFLTCATALPTRPFYHNGRRG